MNADELVGYGLVALGVFAAFAIFVGIVTWVVLCLMQPWAERTVAAHIEAADATEYPELDEGWEPSKRDRGWHRW